MKGKKAIQSKVSSNFISILYSLVRSTDCATCESTLTIHVDPKHSQFPTARIKKIMQEDEEIGKVAAGAPIVICESSASSSSSLFLLLLGHD
jgi:hypothetical protein